MKKMYAIIEAPSTHRLDLSRIIEANGSITEGLKMIERMGAKKIDFQCDFNLNDDEEMIEIVSVAQEIFPAGRVLHKGKIINLVLEPDNNTAFAL